MNKDDVLKKIEDARSAIRQFKAEGQDKGLSQPQKDEVLRASEMLISEARTIGAAGKPCPNCGGSGRV